MDNSEFKKLIEKYKTIEFGRVFNYSQMEESYEGYVETIQHRKVKLGIKTFDDSLGLIRPSQVVTFNGGTNVGKTSVAFQTAFSNSELLEQKLIIIAECEIDENEIYERSIQWEFDMYTFEVENAYKNKNRDLISKFKGLQHKYKNIVSIIYRINTEEIIPYVKAIEEIYQKPCGLLIIDYVGLLKNKYIEEYDKITYSMQKLTEIAIHLQIPVINLSQVPRSDIKNNKEGLGLYSGKGSGEVENSSKILITLDRVFEMPEGMSVDVHEKVAPRDITKKPSHYLIKAKIHKKKQGDFAETYLLFSKKSLRFTDINEIDGGIQQDFYSQTEPF